MAYQADIGNGQTLFIEAQGGTTQLRVYGGGQSQGVGVQTGAGQHKPRLLKLNGELVLELGGSSYYGISQGQLHSLDAAPGLDGAQEVELEAVPDGIGQGAMKPMEPMKGLEPMEPMKPMK
ncbi:hypothetical protein [Deinococcus sp.]|uniref:hypothetical protein n=1 Tax=Deinococcus sp. TaxID=47478 RepID=UPI003CC5F5CD